VRERRLHESAERRIQRAVELARLYPFAAEILAFYREIVSFQRDVYQNLRKPEMAELLPRFPALLRLVSRVGPPGLAESATALVKQEHRWAAMLDAYWDPAGREGIAINPCELVFVRAILQPFAEYLAGRSEIETGVVRNTCPFCGELPLCGVLRPEGEGAKRSLICGLCSTEWQFRRTLCPNCGEEAIDKLPVYIAAEFSHVRVEACDNCKVYLKSVDMTKGGHAVPVVDELATLPLNAWAEERRYTKLFPNLLGL
jgi:FdhE protein